MRLHLTPRARVAGVALLDVAYPPGARYPDHCDGRSRVSVVLRGAVREEACGEDVTATAASVVVKPGDVRHQNAFGPSGARLLSLVAPAAAPADGWRWHHAGPVGGAALRFVRSLGTADAEDDLWAFLAALAAPRAAPRGVPGWVARAREHLDDTVGAGTTVAALAAEAGVHPVSLARAFRRAYGESPSAYRRRARVRAAAGLLASTARPAAAVALEAGFADQSHMCREVRAALGLTPGQLRGLG